MSLLAGSVHVDLIGKADSLLSAMRQGSQAVEKFGGDSDKASKKAKVSFSGIGDIAKVAIGGVVANAFTAAASAIGGSLGSIVSTGAKTESTMVALKTALGGSADAATKAFKQIQTFAASTPYEMQEVTDAFIKLKNYGLEPSEKALTAYGDTASALGKPLNAMIEAVADAATGEFERLKEFGIKSSKEGDRIKFTFGGVTKTVGNNAKEIQAYLQELGATKFGGGMAAQSKTLNGLLSTLADNVTLFGNNLLGIVDGQVQAGGLFDMMRSSLSGVLDVMANPGFVEFSKIIGVKIGEGFKFAGDKLKDFADASSRFVAGIRPAVAGAVDAFQALAMSFRLGSEEDSGLVVSYFLKRLGIPNATEVGDAIARFVAGIRPAVESIPQLIAVVMSNLQSVWQNIQNVIASPIVQSAIKSIADSFMKELVPAVQNLWQTFSTLLMPVLTQIWNFLGQVLPPILAALAVIFAVTLYNATQIIIKGFALLVNAINVAINAFTTISSAVMAIFGTIVAFLTATFQTIVAIFTGNFSSISGIWTEFLNKISQLWSDAWNTISAALKNIWNVIVTLVTTKFDEIVSAVKSGVDAVGRLINTMKDNVINTIKNINLFQIGQDMIGGLINGVGSMAGALASKVGSMADSAVRTMKASLGVKSPSVIFKQIGVHTIEGFNLGIEESAPAIESKMNMIANYAAQPFATTSSNSTTTNNYNSTSNNNYYQQSQNNFGFLDLNLI